MVWLHRSLALALVGACALASGCAFVPKSQLTACESRNRILTEQTDAQQAEIVNLKEHSRKIENQLLETQQQLAALEQRAQGNEQRVANYEQERQRLQDHLAGLVRDARLSAASGPTTSAASGGWRNPSISGGSVTR